MKETRFKDWDIDMYKAISPDKKYVFWVANGFLSFKDHECHTPRQSILADLSIWHRYKIWREFLLEKTIRCRDFLRGEQV